MNGFCFLGFIGYWVSAQIELSFFGFLHNLGLVNENLRVFDDWLLFEVLLSNSFSHNLDSVYEIYGFC